MKVHSIFAHPYANRRNAVIWPEMPKSTGIHPIHVRPQILRRKKRSMIQMTVIITRPLSCLLRASIIAPISVRMRFPFFKRK
jgi:hypothetical protein